MSPQGTPNLPRNSVGKGLMTAHNLIINKLIALVVLLVKDKQHAVQMAYSIVKDLDFSKCPKHKTEALGDFGHFDLIRVIYSMSQFYSIMYCNCTNRLSLQGFYEDTSTSNLVCR